MEQSVWDTAFEEVDTSFEDINLQDSLGNIPEVPKPLQTKQAGFDLDPPSLDLTTLLEVGKLTKIVNLRGHKIRIKTLTVGEELEVALLTKEYQGTSEELRAFCVATVAASVEDINGQPLIMTLGPNENALFRKFEYIRENWYWPVVQELFKEYSELQSQVVSSLEELKKN